MTSQWYDVTVKFLTGQRQSGDQFRAGDEAMGGGVGVVASGEVAVV